MTEQKVHELLQRYFNGATSLGEERELQRCFAEREIPRSLRAYQPLFAFFAEERAVEPPARKPAAHSFRRRMSVITGIAASIAVLLLVGLPKTQSFRDYTYYVDGQRVYDQIAAVEAAENKLQMLAASMQKARSGMAAFEAVQGSSQSLQQLGKIASAYRQAEKVSLKLQEATLTEVN